MELAAEHFVLEGGLSIGFHMQRSMGTLMLPEKLQPWNRNSWQQGQLNDLLYLRANKKAEALANVDERQGESKQMGEPMGIEQPASKEWSVFAKTAAIAGNPLKADKWRCLEELVWLQHGSKKAPQFLHIRDAGNLDFIGIENLDPDRADSFGPEVMNQLHELWTAFIGEKIEEGKKTYFCLPTVVRTTSEDERQEVLNFFRPIADRVKVGGLPTPPQPVKGTVPSRASAEKDAGKAGWVRFHNDNRQREPRDREGVEMGGKKIDRARDMAAVESDKDVNPARRPLQDDYDLIEYSEEDGPPDDGAPNGDECIHAPDQEINVATPSESERDEESAGREGESKQDIPMPLNLPVDHVGRNCTSSS
jgi:hypothetical protein